MGFITMLVSAMALFRTNADIPMTPTFGSCLADSKFVLQSGKIYQSPLYNNTLVVSVVFNNIFQAIENATIYYTINLNGVPYSFSETMCSLSDKFCPISLGSNEFNTKPFEISDVSGRIKIIAYVTSMNGSDLMCVFGDMMVNNGIITGLIPYDTHEVADADYSNDVDENDQNFTEEAEEEYEEDEFTENFDEADEEYEFTENAKNAEEEMEQEQDLDESYIEAHGDYTDHENN